MQSAFTHWETVVDVPLTVFCPWYSNYGKWTALTWCFSPLQSASQFVSHSNAQLWQQSCRSVVKCPALGYFDTLTGGARDRTAMNGLLLMCKQKARAGNCCGYCVFRLLFDSSTAQK